MRGRSALMVAAVMGLMGGAMTPTLASTALAAGSHATLEEAVMRTRQPRGTTLREIFGGRFDGRSSARRAGYGWTNRHARRVALKKRNQARHRAAGRGGR